MNRRVVTIFAALVLVVCGLVLGFSRIGLLDGTDCGSAFKPRAEEIATVDVYREYGRVGTGQAPNPGYMADALACEAKTDGRRTPAVLFLVLGVVAGLVTLFVGRRKDENSRTESRDRAE
jgi:hypothetical protein